MKVSKRNIKLIKERMEYLYDNFNVEPSNEIRIGDDEIFVDFPDDNGDITYSVDDFLRYTDNLNDIKKIDNHTVVSGKIRQTIIDVDLYSYEYLVPTLSFETGKYSLRIVSNPFLVGLIASRDGIYNEEFGVSSCSIYMAVELIYKYGEPDENGDIEFIKTCLYHLASKYGISASIGEFQTWEDITDEENNDSVTVNEEELIPYCNAMNYYMEGLSIGKQDIKYLHFYKIIEYFSPIVSKKASYEQLNKRLDALQLVKRDTEYLESIFILTKHYEISLKDKELAYTVLNECVDILSLFRFLPEKLQKMISKNTHFEIKDINTLNSTDIEVVKKEVSAILYATRNSIVHAKSNYVVTGKECKEEDLEQLNKFMAKLCECLFIWNGRQAREFQLR